MTGAGAAAATPRLVGTFGARDAASLLAVLADPATLAADVVEVRLDLARDGAERVEELVRASPRPVLATCRRASEGGGFAGAEPGRRDVLRRAAGAGAAWIDVEDDVPDAFVEDVVRAGAAVVRSLHVERVHSGAGDEVGRLLRGPVCAAKWVARRGDAGDALRVLELVAAHGGRLAAHVVDVPFTRAASAALGAPFVYAALRPGGSIGVPMPTVRWMRDHARFSRLRPGRRIFLLLGGDVEGSVSPDLLNAAFEATGPDCVALRWSCASPAPALEALRRFGWAGAAVTIPHKETVHAVLAAAGTLGASAVEAGSVNTVVVERTPDGTPRLAGHTTDVAGLLDALRPALPREGVAGRAFLVLGAGGAARAAVVAARRLGARPVVLARRPDAARRLGADVAADAPAAAACAPAVVADATPAGPPGGVPWFDPATLPSRAVVVDMLVHAVPTALLEAATRAGHVPVAGFEMLVHQAAHQVALLGGPPPDVHRMADAGMRVLRARDAPVVLVGLRCAGKTTVGRRVADLLGRTFLDTDDEVARRTGEPVDAMLRAGREAEFRRVEAAVLADVARGAGAVVATGGGAALHRAEIAALSAAGTVVLLDAPDAVLLARRAASPRVALTSMPPAEELAQQRAERLPVYRALAAFTVDVSALDAEAVAELVASRVEMPQDRAPAP